MADAVFGIKIAVSGADAVVSAARSVGGAMEGAGQQATTSFSKTRQGIESISTQLKTLENYAKAWLGVSQLVDLTRSVIKTADEYTSLQAGLKLATTSQLEFNTANAALYAIAQKNGVPLAESLSLYSKLSPALREMGASQAQTLVMTDLVGKSLRISGAGAAESSAAMLQFSQALGSGVLRGDEFNSLMENSPRLMKAVADGLNRPIGELRKMAEQGQLTADVVVNALLSQKSKLEAEYSGLPLTVSAAWTKLGNSVTQEIGRLDKAGGGLSSGLAKALGGVADNLDKVGVAFTAAGVALGSFAVMKAVDASISYIAALQAERAAAIAVAEAEVRRVAMTYTASTASRVAAASALTQATATGTLAGVVGTATAAIRAFVVANPYLLVAAAIGTATFAATKLFEESINGFANFQKKIKELSGAELSQQRALLNAELIGMKNSIFSGFYEKDIRMGEDRLRLMDAQIVKQNEMAKAGSPAANLAPKISLGDYLANGQSQAQARAKALKDEDDYYHRLIAQNKGNQAVLEQIESAHQVRMADIGLKYKDKKTASPVDSEAKRFADLSAQSANHIAALAAEAGANEKLNAAEKALAEFRTQIAAGTTGLKGGHVAARQAQLEAEVAYTNHRDYLLAEQKAREDNLKSIADETAKIRAQTVGLNEQTAELGKSRAEINLLKAARDDAAISQAETTLKTLDDIPANQAQIKLLRDEIAARKELRGAYQANAAQQAVVAAAEDYKKRGDEISKTLSDALMRGFEGGKGATLNFAETFKNMFKTMILEPRIKASVQPLAEALNRLIDGFAKGISDALSQSASAPAGGGFLSGIGSIIGGLFNANGNAFATQGVQAFANGGSFTNTIVAQPTPFAFGGKLGVMGEAGPEAVLPLTRTAGGQLGVRAEISAVQASAAKMASAANDSTGWQALAAGMTGVATAITLGLGQVDSAYAALPPASANYLSQISGSAVSNTVAPVQQPFFAPLPAAPALASAAQSRPAAPTITVNLINAPAGTQVKQQQVSQDGNGTLTLDLIFEQIDARMASNVQRGNGQLVGVMENTYGLNRAVGAYR